MNKENVSVLFVYGNDFLNDQATVYQMNSIIIKLNKRFPSLFKTDKWQHYVYHTDRINGEVKLLICLDQKAYSDTIKKYKDVPIIKLNRYRTKSCHYNRKLKTKINQASRVGINVQVLKILNSLETTLEKL